MQLTILKFDVIDSTNSEATRQAKLGVHEGLCVIAGRQTAGRGRHGRVWVSEEGAGLYFSIVLRPRLEPRHLTLLTLMSAVAVRETLALFGIDGDIKWVNDILVGGRKISGILAEATETPAGPAVIVGIGINLRTGSFPPEMGDQATSVEAVTGVAPVASAVADELIIQLTNCYARLRSEGGPEWVREEWTRHSSFAAGKYVTVRTGSETFEGVTRGIEENGALRVETATGESRVVQAGEVTALRAKN